MNACVRAFGIAFLVGSMATAHAADAIVQGTPACRPHDQQASPEKDDAHCAPQDSVEDADRAGDGTERVEMTVGSPPMQSDDTGTPGPGNWEINLGIYGDLTGGQRLGWPRSSGRISILRTRRLSCSTSASAGKSPTDSRYLRLSGATSMSVPTDTSMLTSPLPIRWCSGSRKRSG